MWFVCMSKYSEGKRKSLVNSDLPHFLFLFDIRYIDNVKAIFMMIILHENTHTRMQHKYKEVGKDHDVSLTEAIRIQYDSICYDSIP